MICKYCGKSIASDARFCQYCGKPASCGKVCPQCGWEAQDDSVYCQKCGALLKGGGATSVEQDVQVRMAQTVSTPHIPSGPDIQSKVRSDKLLKTAKMYSLYNGTPTVGAAKASGDLRVYGDRVEFDPKMGNSIGGAFGLIGIAVAARKKPSLQTYRLDGMAGVEVGKYAGVYNSLVLRMKDGTVVSLVPAIPGSREPEEIAGLIKLYL